MMGGILVLRGKQKRFLRSQAHHMKPTFQIGKDGLDAAWLNAVEKSLDRNELIKVAILQNSLLEASEVKEWIEQNSAINVVQVIGHTLVLYQRSRQAKFRQLSKQVQLLA